MPVNSWRLPCPVIWLNSIRDVPRVVWRKSFPFPDPRSCCKREFEGVARAGSEVLSPRPNRWGPRYLTNHVCGMTLGVFTPNKWGALPHLKTGHTTRFLLVPSPSISIPLRGGGRCIPY
jgi:hypothetical protein